MRIENEFNIGDEVYLKTDEDQIKRIVTGITIRQGPSIIYDLACGEYETPHFGIEITSQREL